MYLVWVRKDFTDTNRDAIDIWELSIDFAEPANSIFAGPVSLPISEYTDSSAGIPQPATSTRLSAKGSLGWRLQYRNFPTHEALIGSFDRLAAGRYGVRWFELRKDSGDVWRVHQEGMHSPDLTNRWMESIAMDGDGNIALAYSVSSNEVFPGLRYSGRLATDPLGLLPEPEQTLVAGGGSLTGTSPARWGDYSALTVDPTNDCTFWFTGEYMSSSSPQAWSTRIGRFAFESCTAKTCGNGIMDPAELCDDGNTLVGDGCRSNCTLERCGDGLQDPEEECDDGNASNEDGCSTNCIVVPEPGQALLASMGTLVMLAARRSRTWRPMPPATTGTD